MIFNKAAGPRWPTPPCHADHAAGTSDDGVEKRAFEAVGYGFKHGLTMFQKPTGGTYWSKMGHLDRTCFAKRLKSTVHPGKTGVLLQAPLGNSTNCTCRQEGLRFL